MVLIVLSSLTPPAQRGGCYLVGSWRCHGCRRKIRRLEEPLCRRCGAELDSRQDTCGCRTRMHALSRLRSAVAYEGPVERLVHRFKYQGWRALATPLALLLCDRIVVEGLASSFVVPVPLHRKSRPPPAFTQADPLTPHLLRPP